MQTKDHDLIPYKIGSHTIMIAADHNLPAFQKIHRLYDRFIPYLCSEIDNDRDYIIDVGANIGDTACAILQSCANPLICIEGHDAYFHILETNIKSLPGASRVKNVCAIVGTGRFSGALVDDGTTAMLSVGGLTPNAVRLDDIVGNLGVSEESICLIKLDTDGYDADVILSAENVITKSEPLLFWENYFSNVEQILLLDQLYDILDGWGYDSLWIFDNFGNIILENCTFKQARDLNFYIESQSVEGNTRTIWYTDILASTTKGSAQAQRAIAKFREKIADAER